VYTPLSCRIAAEKARLGRLEQHAIVIAHEAMGVTEHAVIIVFEYRASIISTRRDVVDATWKLEAERPGHAPTLPLRPPRAQV